MPFIAPLVPILTGIAAAGTIGSTVYGLTQGGGGAPNTTQQDQAAALKQAQADADAKRKAILASLPNAQEQGGGALQAPSLTELASVIAGLPGETNTAAGRGALSTFLGSTPQTGTSTSPSGGNLVESTYGLSGSQG
jgi:hypothetical protein